MSPVNRNAPVAARTAHEESLGEWLALHKTSLGWGALALVVLVGGGWFYERSQDLKAARAEKAYYQARQEAAAGNSALAASDLSKMAERYSGTRSGVAGRIYLAQMDFEQRKIKEGIAEL